MLTADVTPSQCGSCPLRSFTVYRSLPDAEIDALVNLRHRVITAGARSVIVRENQTPDEVYTLLEGWAFRYKLLADGRRQILSYLLPGDFVTMQAFRAEPLFFSVQALTPVRLCAFDREQFAEFLAGQPEILKDVVSICQQQLNILDHRIVNLGRRSALERIARFFFMISARLAERGIAAAEKWNCPLRQEHIADTLGLTPVHVSRTLATLRGQGLMTLENGVVTIYDRAQLANLAGQPSPGTAA